MKNYNDVKFEGSDYLLSLEKILDVKVKDIVGYLSSEYDEPVFKLIRIIFEDGTELGVEGEHDFPYLTEYGENTAKNYTEEILNNIYKTDPDNEDED